MIHINAARQRIVVLPIGTMALALMLDAAAVAVLFHGFSLETISVVVIAALVTAWTLSSFITISLVAQVVATRSLFTKRVMPVDASTRVVVSA